MPKTKTQKQTKKPTKKGLSKPNATKKKKVVAKKPVKQQESATPCEKLNKTDQVIALISRPEGTTLEEITKLTGWKSHTARGVISLSLRKKKGLQIVTEKDENGKRVYRIAA